MPWGVGWSHTFSRGHYLNAAGLCSFSGLPAQRSASTMSTLRPDASRPPSKQERLLPICENIFPAVADPWQFDFAPTPHHMSDPPLSRIGLGPCCEDSDALCSTLHGASLHLGPNGN